MSAPDARYRHEWLPYEREPGQLIFLLGCQRSGTTLLHLLLARTGLPRCLTAYDVWAADRLVYNQRHGLARGARAAFAGLLAAKETSDRGIDAIPASADTPEEYGLIIASALGQPGLRYGRPDTTPATLPALLEICAKKALLEGTDKPLLLKNPPDYADAVPLLARAFPEARFIAVQRHPLPTLDSQVRSWRAALLRRNEYLALVDPGYRALFEAPGPRMRLGLFLHSAPGVDWLAERILRSHLAFLSQAPLLEGRLLTLRYEDLCADQAGQFQRLSAFLGSELPVPAGRPAPRQCEPGGEALRAYRALAERFAPYLAMCGYAAEAA